jgi:hypothetical protein
MTGQIQAWVDGIVADLTANVSGLGTAELHRYAPWDPEELFAQSGETHLAVWPLADAESGEPLTSDAHKLIQLYAITVWQDASDSQSRRIHDETATLAFLDIWEATRNRLYKVANEFMGGSELSWYQGTTFDPGSGLTRWFAITCRVEQFLGFT